MPNTKSCGFGSHEGYQRHRYWGEPPCKACKVAHAAYERVQRRKRARLKAKEGRVFHREDE